MGFNDRYESWKKRVKDRKLLRELLIMPEEEKFPAFSKDLEFGTAGIRGIMGPGTNRLNIYTVRKITHGLALYMLVRKMRKAVIGYDSRINSEAFAREAACTLAAVGIEAVIVTELMPSPFLSYATRRLNADMGIMITASHNPREYNGYKIYDSKGCQIRNDVAQYIATNISRVDAFRLRMHSFDYYMKRGLIFYMPEEVETDYLSELEKLDFGRADGLNVVYTPLNGTGYRIVPMVLKSIGCKLYSVPDQDQPSGKFSTCPIPNPEKKEALRSGIKVLKSYNADVLIANDPDADRIGVVYLNKNGEAEVLSGNELGVIMSEYLLSRVDPQIEPIIVKTLVSSELADRIAEAHGGKAISVLTGFKYIGEVINRLEDRGESDRFILGFEESQGYLIGTHVRDKDGVIAAKLVAAIAAQLKTQGKTLGDKLNEIYKKYGHYLEKQIAYSFEGEIDNKIELLMTKLRDCTPVTIGNRPLLRSVDYLHGVGDIPAANLLKFVFDGGHVLIRPSGTEPLIKLYVSIHLKNEENERIFKQIKRQFDEILIKKGVACAF